MKYIDSGLREPSQTLAQWFEETLLTDVEELRLQSGFFSIDGISPLTPELTRLEKDNKVTNILIGSNDKSTLKQDVEQLVEMLGIPRSNAKLGIVSFRGAYFHPKTYHVKRADGSQAAFIGSANLTRSGLALHVEAGIALDTKNGDCADLLSDIANAIDSWFVEQRIGLNVVGDKNDVDSLAQRQVIAMEALPKKEQETQGNDAPSEGQPTDTPKLAPLKSIPSIRSASSNQSTGQPNLAVQAHTRGIATRKEFPPYLLFQPNATQATANEDALSGTFLPSGAKGLIIRLNRDSARHFMGRSGTANISVPVATISSLRFGISGRHNRPRAEFDLKMRFVSDSMTIAVDAASTNVMGYGFTQGESGHGDIRLLVPAKTRELGDNIIAAGYSKPTDGDFAFLEWPNIGDPSFKITFLENRSTYFSQARELFSIASENNEIVGASSCWLPNNISPAW